MPERIPESFDIEIVYPRCISWFHDMEEVWWEKKGHDGKPQFGYHRQKKPKIWLPPPSSEQWDKFMGSLKALGVFSWRSVEIPVPDDIAHLAGYESTGWMIRFEYPDHNFEITGPLDKLPEGFDRFCAAISELLGGHEFGADLWKDE